MASITSERSGTKTVAVVIPRIKNPVIDKALLYSYSGPRSIEGPIRKVPTVATPKETYVMYRVGILLAAKATKGLKIEYANARAPNK